MKRATVISLVGHGAILAWALLSFARPFEKLEGEMFPVDVLTASDFSKIAAGDLKAPPSETPKPVVDKIAEPTPPPEDPTASVDKREVKAAVEESRSEPTPPKPEPKPVEKAEPEKKIDPIAEALKKDEAKKPEKKPEPKPQPEKKEAKERKFDPRQIQANLDKRKPTRLVAAGSELNSVVSRGAPSGSAPVLTADEKAQIQRRLTRNWHLAGIDNKDIVVGIYVQLRIDGTLAAEPEITTRGSGPAYDAVKRSARAAVMASVPFEFLKPARYEYWKELDLDFTPDR